MMFGGDGVIGRANRQEELRRAVLTLLAHARLTPAMLAATIVAFGGVLRFNHLTSLSLWTDEGLTIQYARLPWPALLGFHGNYSVHPPLYYALVKLAMTFPLREALSGRLISAVAGTLTIAVLYALVTRLLDWRAGLLAGLLLSVSPLHLWYSQEARQYAAAALLVALSYLALVAFSQDHRRGWAIIYGLSLAAALYLEYSALFALAPQVILLAVLLYRQRSAILPLFYAGAAATLAFLPWLPHLLGSAGPAGGQGQFALTLPKVEDSILAALGVAGNGGYFWGSIETPWEQWPFLHPVLLLAVGVILTLGLAALLRRSLIGLLVALTLFPGTVGVAVLISLRYPGYTDRTVLYAVLGWVILIGAAPFASLRARPRPVRTTDASGRSADGDRASSSRVGSLAAGLTGVAATAIMLIASLLSVHAIYAGGDKQHWQALASDVDAVQRFGWPILTYPTVAGTLIGVYRPESLADHALLLHDGQRLPSFERAFDRRPSALWLAYTSAPGLATLQSQLKARGYIRRVHRYYWNPLYLDLYVRRGATLGKPLAVNGEFAHRAAGWTLPPRGVHLHRYGANRTVLLRNRTMSETGVSIQLPAQPNALYLLRLQARSWLHTGGLRMFLICLSSTGSYLDITPNGAGATVPVGGWHSVSITALCPSATNAVRIDLRNSGVGSAGFRDVGVRVVSP